jgi:hypothetical protein
MTRTFDPFPVNRSEFEQGISKQNLFRKKSQFRVVLKSDKPFNWVECVSYPGVLDGEEIESISIIMLTITAAKSGEIR